MAQFAYPIIDTETGNWVPSTGTVLYSTVDESPVPDDADYMRSPLTTGDVTIQLWQDTTLITTRTVTPSIIGFETFVLTLTAEEVSNITNWGQLYIHLTVNGSSTAKLKLTRLGTPIAGTTTLRICARITAGS